VEARENSFLSQKRRFWYFLKDLKNSVSASPFSPFRNGSSPKKRPFYGLRKIGISVFALLRPPVLPRTSEGQVICAGFCLTDAKY